MFLAHDPTLRREVALKVPRAESLLTPQHRIRFRREGQAAASLDHPNIVPVYEAGEAGAVSFIASAYIRGETLAAWIRKRGDEPIPIRTAALLILAVSEGVAHAHRRGILHRDLKPANILLDTSQEHEDAPAGRTRDMLPFTPKITDFGLAKDLAD